MEKNNTRESLRQFISFCIIGLINSGVDFGIYYLLTRHTAFFNVATPRKYLANCVSFLVATTSSFFANRTFTFRMKKSPTWPEAMRFYSTTTSGLIFSTLIFFGLVRWFGVFDLLAKLASSGYTIVWNFTLKKLWVFPKLDNSNKT